MSQQNSPDDRAIALHFADDGKIPNSKLPLLVYRQAVPKGQVTPAAIEAVFDKAGWSPQWRSTVFTYHHYHSTAHEVLGVASGWALVMMGGPSGEELKISAGDIMLIPAGVGHKRLDSSSDFMVCGAYPPGQDWDILRGEPGDRPMADENIARVPMPDTDPVCGNEGPVFTYWQSAT